MTPAEINKITAITRFARRMDEVADSPLRNSVWRHTTLAIALIQSTANRSIGGQTKVAFWNSQYEL
jgi:hypothetical protein